MKNITELDQTAQLLRVSWRKAHNYYVSFAKTFFEVRKDFEKGVYDPKWTFAMWLGQKAGLSEDQIMKQLKLFDRTLPSEERDILTAKTREIERRQRAEKIAAATERNAQIEQKRKLDTEAKAMKEAAKQEKLTERAKREAEAKRNLANAKRRDTNKQNREARKIIRPLPDDVSIKQLFNEIHNGQKRVNAVQEEWISATMQIAIALVKLREQYPSDIQFSELLALNNVNYNKDDRAALLGFGYDPMAARKALEQTDRRSWQHIWREMKKDTTVIPIA